MLFFLSWVRSCRKRILVYHPKFGLTLDGGRPERPWPIWMNRDHLRPLVSNLLQNLWEKREWWEHVARSLRPVLLKCADK